MARKTIKSGRRERIDYSRIKTNVEIPNLIEIQLDSFKDFIENGLKELFEDISPIESENTGRGTEKNFELTFGDYEFDEPKYSIGQAKSRSMFYSQPLKVNVVLTDKDSGQKIESKIFMGDLPMMTPVGTFIVNGSERVIVSQIVRSAGCFYTSELDTNGKIIYACKLIPTRGAWIEYDTTSKDLLVAKVDRSKKIGLTTFVKALGFKEDKDIIELLGDTEQVIKSLADERDKKKIININDAIVDVYSKIGQGDRLSPENAKLKIREKLFDVQRYDLADLGRFKLNRKLEIFDRIKGHYLAEDIENPETGEVILEAGVKIGRDEIDVIRANRSLLRKEFALSDGIIPDAYLDENGVEVNEAVVERIVIKTERSMKDDSSKSFVVLGTCPEIPGVTTREMLRVTASDILASISYYMNLPHEIGSLDEIDHLGNRRLRLVGELLKNQYRIGLTKLAKKIKDRMASVNDTNDMHPKNLINIRPLTSTLREFFGSSQLSQFMDQLNSLSKLTHKRRISALGSGGLTRDRAGFEVRDVHSSHYGRVCPIETPEGPNIGLINYLATYAKVNQFGFIETPFLKVENGVVTNEVTYLAAYDETDYIIAQANAKVSEDNNLVDDFVICRQNGETALFAKNDINFIDVSPKQIVSVATSCIPFLEHDDASRALMGANMQRQALPLLIPDAPYVGTGMEHKAAKDSGDCVLAEEEGIVTYVDGKRIVIKNYEGRQKEYELTKFDRSNNNTSLLQTPIVNVGDEVKRHEIIADGPCMDQGELALGQNPVVAFMTWHGYNYEDAIIMSERLVKDDVYTSIHIHVHSIEARDTKLGKEEFTTEIPNVSANQKRYLDKDGIIIPGAEVKPGDILVGKVTPRSLSEPTAEEKLLLAIFGEKSRDVRDTSLKVSPGEAGVVSAVKHFKRENGDELPPGVNETVYVYIIKKRKISEGDKMAGRHGNKGVISKILPVEDMPYLEDGTPVDIMLNPLGVPSRMNIGQVLELHLGMAAKRLGKYVSTPVFDGCKQEDLLDIMKEAGMKETGKFSLTDGRTGVKYDNDVSVGVMYMIKLSHMVDDKLHARSVGPYTLVTQQPMGGKAQNGGQRFGEMEVWALEAYGAAYTLQEMITIKSDDITGRNKVYRAITKDEPIPTASIPESFRVLIRELQSLGISVKLHNSSTGENDALKSILSEDDNFIQKYALDK